MKVSIICVGRPRGPIADVIAEYEERAARYFRFEAIEVREAKGRRQPVAQILQEEGERLLARLPDHNELVALHRRGPAVGSIEVAGHLQEAALRSLPGVSFVIGGAFGLSPDVIERADRLLSLSGMTLPHELARLILAEQLYRAGTIIRGEPYHKEGPG